MTTRNGINVSGTYVVHHKFYTFFMYVFCILKNERLDGIIFYTPIVFIT